MTVREAFKALPGFVKVDFTQEKGEVATARLIATQDDLTSQQATKVLGVSADEFTISTWKASPHEPIFLATITGLDSREKAAEFTSILETKLEGTKSVTYRTTDEPGQIAAYVSMRQSTVSERDVRKVIEAASLAVQIHDWTLVDEIP